MRVKNPKTSNETSRYFTYEYMNSNSFTVNRTQNKNSTNSEDVFLRTDLEISNITVTSTLRSEFQNISNSNISDDIYKCTKEDAEFLLENLQEGVSIPLSENIGYFGALARGKYVAGDCKSCIDKPPEWLDILKFQKGQRFAMKHIFGLFYAQLLSLFLLFSFPKSLEPLIFTRKSDNPFNSFKRYLSTNLRVKSWYESDFWVKDSSARKNLKSVRCMHAKVRQKMRSYSSEQLEKKLNSISSSFSNTNGCTKKLTLLKEDFKSYCPFTVNLDQFSKNKNEFLSQTEMAVAQFGFVGLMILYPGKFGAPDATDEDLDCFLHLWRVIGYCLGIDDKYNFCNASLAEVKQRSDDLIRYFFKPSLSRLTTDWEHMSRCVIEGGSYYTPGVSFEALLYYLIHVLGLQSPRFYDSLSVFQKLSFSVTCLLLQDFSKFHLARIFLNLFTHMCLRKADNGSKKWLKSLENRSYQYMNRDKTMH